MGQIVMYCFINLRCNTEFALENWKKRASLVYRIETKSCLNRTEKKQEDESNLRRFSVVMGMM